MMMATMMILMMMMCVSTYLNTTILSGSTVMFQEQFILFEYLLGWCGVLIEPEGSVKTPPHSADVGLWMWSHCI